MGRSSLDPGTVLGDGRYRIVRMLGRGGMGAVYEALRVDLGRPVAVKLLDAAAGAPGDVLAATEREALAAARLAHPHIVQVIDFSRGGPDEKPFFVMELLEGESLDQRLAREALPQGTAALVAVQVLSALAAAHASGILHRDVKPANVFLTHTATTADFVKLLDFGIAWNLAGASVRSATLHAGTPSYMAPEQIRGEDLDPRTDVWGAGACLYEMLAGRPPFEGSTVPMLLVNVSRADPKPIGGISPGLEAIVRRALEKDPARRFPSADAMRAALAPFAVYGAVPSRDLVAVRREPLEIAETVAATPAAEATVANAASSPRAASAATLASIASAAASPAPAPERPWGLLFAAAAAAAFTIAAAAIVAPRMTHAPPPLPSSPSICVFSQELLLGEDVTHVRLAATPERVLFVTAEGGRAVHASTIASPASGFERWNDSMAFRVFDARDRVFPCAVVRDQLYAGGVRMRAAPDSRYLTVFGEYGEPGPDGLRGKGPLHAFNRDFFTSGGDCAGEGTRTVYATYGGRRPDEDGDLRVIVTDGPRNEQLSSYLKLDTATVRVSVFDDTIAVLAFYEREPILVLYDARTLQRARPLHFPTPALHDGAVAVGPSTVDALWIEESPRALRWTAVDRNLATKVSILAQGDVFSPAIARRGDGVVLAWAEREGGRVRLHAGAGATPEAAARSAASILVPGELRGLQVAGSPRPWVAWIDGGVVRTSQLACP